LSTPGSWLMMARIAEASSTRLFIPGCLTAFREQFLNQGSAGLEIRACPLLRALDAALNGLSLEQRIAVKSQLLRAGAIA